MSMPVKSTRNVNEPVISPAKMCGTCRKTDEKLLKCSVCAKMWYCNKECQNMDWPNHRKVCQYSGTSMFPITNFHTSPNSRNLVTSFTLLQTQQLSEEQSNVANQLMAIKNIDSILDNSEVKKDVKTLGQQLFDKYKADSDGKTSVGKDAVTAVCDWIGSNQTESRNNAQKRQKCIEYAWSGIGDDEWRWMP